MNIERLNILNAIFSKFQSAGQYITTNPSSYAEYISSAAALIQLLEVADCGSTGGFDKNNKRKSVTNFKVFDRFLTLVRKYENENDIESICGFTLESLGQFYNQLNSLRSTF